jgi:dATP pyrophosphohydrolase
MPGMTRIPPNAVAVYVYRRVPSGVEFLQIRRSTQSRTHHESWQTVYGGIEAGETAVQAALRELKEETGLVPARMFQVEYLESFYFQHSDSLTFMPVFAVEVSPEAIITLNHEHTAARWVPEGDIGGAFMWRTQREALGILLEALRSPSSAMRFLDIPCK